MNKTVKAKRMMIFCEPCSYKKIVEPNEEPNLTEIKVSSVPGGIPQLDPKTNKTIIKPVLQQCKKYKCPCCGRGVILKEIQPAYAKVLQEIDERKQKEQQEADRLKRLADGKPEEKKSDPEFLG